MLAIIIIIFIIIIIINQKNLVSQGQKAGTFSSLLYGAPPYFSSAFS